MGGNEIKGKRVAVIVVLAIAVIALWRLPTKEEQDELVEKCDWKKGSYNGVKGYTVTGPNGNTIFLPGVGGRIANETHYQVDGADYWSGTLGSNTDTAYYLYYYIGEDPTVGTLPRYYGFSVLLLP